jgi:hypothetical protein
MRAQEATITGADVGGPLLEASADRDVAWGVGMSMPCECGSGVGLRHRRCRSCGRTNPLARLLRRRRRVDRWIGRQIDRRLLARIDEADGIPQVVRRYEKKLAQIAEHPLPERHRWEDSSSYVKRCIEFIPYMFENSSPTTIAQEIDDRLRTSADRMSRVAVAATDHIVDGGTGVQPAPVPEVAVNEHARGLVVDLGKLLVPYLEALKVMKMYHDRMVKAWSTARPILERPVPSGALVAAWAKIRATVNPIGPFLKFGTAIWQNSNERSTLRRLEIEIARFHRQAERFNMESTRLGRGRRRLHRMWRLSLTRYVARRLREQIVAADPSSRQAMIDHLLDQSSFGSRLRRLRPGRAAEPAHG